MNRMKQFLSLALALILTLSLTPMQVQAASDTMVFTDVVIPDGVTAFVRFGNYDIVLMYADAIGREGTLNSGNNNLTREEYRNREFITLRTLLNVPDGTKYIIEGITIPGSMETLSKETFNLPYPNPNENLKRITLQDGVREIGENMFSRCTGLESVILPNSLREIGLWAFSSCEKLKSITLPAGLEKIGDYAFEYSGLTEVTLKEGLKEIGDKAFARTKLKKVVIPDGTIIIGNGAFNGCTDLTDLTIPSSAVVMDNIFDIDEWFIENNDYFTNSEKYKNDFLPISPKLTIHGAPGSAAEKYAKTIGARFDAISAPVAPAVTKPSVPIAQRFNEYKAEIERKYSVALTFNKSSSGSILHLSMLDDFLSMIPPALHNSIVNHFKSKGKTITIRVTNLNGPVGLYDHTNVRISLEDNYMGLNGGTFAHEYGHMLHSAVVDKIGRAKFNSEFKRLRGVEPNDEYIAGIYERNIPQSYRKGEDYNAAIAYIKANYEPDYFMYTELMSDLTDNYNDATAFNTVASSALKVSGVFFTYFYKPQTPSTWAAEAVKRAFAGEWSAEGILGAEYDDSHIYQLAINREEFCSYILSMLDSAFFEKNGKKLATTDRSNRLKLLDIKTGEYVYVNDYSAKPLKKYDDISYEETAASVAQWYGIVTGVNDSRFNPRGELTREQAAVILYRTATLLGLPDAGGTATVADAASVPSWAKEGVDYCVRNGIMTSTGGGNFSPKQAYSFEQAIVTLVRLYDSVQ